MSSYVVEMLDSATKSWQRIAETLKAPVFTIADLTPGEEYAFRVSASNQFGVGEPTEKVSVHLPMEKGESNLFHFLMTLLYTYIVFLMYTRFLLPFP